MNIKELEKASKYVYLACPEKVADDLASKLLWAIDEIKSLKAQLSQARETERNMLKEMELISSEKVRNHGVQKCPKCDGQGIVSKRTELSADGLPFCLYNKNEQCPTPFLCNDCDDAPKEKE